MESRRAAAGARYFERCALVFRAAQQQPPPLRCRDCNSTKVSGFRRILLHASSVHSHALTLLIFFPFCLKFLWEGLSSKRPPPAKLFLCNNTGAGVTLSQFLFCFSFRSFCFFYTQVIAAFYSPAERLVSRSPLWTETSEARVVILKGSKS